MQPTPLDIPPRTKSKQPAQVARADEASVQELPSVAGFNEVRDALAIVRAAVAFLAEGHNRVTATQLCEAARDFGTFLEPWQVGQITARNGIGTKASHGKARLALDMDQLTLLRDELAGKVDAQAPLFDEELARFNLLGERVAAMRERVLAVTHLQDEARRMKEFIDQTRNIERVVAAYREQAASLKQQAETADKFGPYIAQLEAKAKSLPQLKERRAKLEKRLAEAEAHGKELDQHERVVTRTEAENVQRAAALDRKADDVQRRTQTLTLAEIEQQTADAKRELDTVLKQLGEKKGLLSKMFGSGGQS